MKFNKWILFAIVLLIILRLPTISQLTLSDESLYIIMARSWINGYTPYTNGFFCAHPPGMIFLITPFVSSIILFRLFLITLQVIIILLCYLITENEFVGLILTLNPLFSLLNVYLGFSTMILLLLLAYYFKDKWYCVIFASLALLTRLFAIFPLFILGFFWLKRKDSRRHTQCIKMKKEVKEVLFLAMVCAPFVMMCLLTPNFLSQVFLYHADKIPMLLKDKLITLAIALISLSPLIIPLKFKRYNKELLAMAGIMLAGILIQKSFFITYFSPVMLLLACSMLKGLGKEETKLVLLLSAPLIMFSIINNYQLYVSPADLILNESLMITGESGTMHAYALANNLELINTVREPGGVMDTSNYRFSNEMGYFKSFMHNESNYYLIINACGETQCWINYVNMSNYNLVRIDTFNNNQKVIITKKK